MTGFGGELLRLLAERWLVGAYVTAIFAVAKFLIAIELAWLAYPAVCVGLLYLPAVWMRVSRSLASR